MLYIEHQIPDALEVRFDRVRWQEHRQLWIIAIRIGVGRKVRPIVKNWLGYVSWLRRERECRLAECEAVSTGICRVKQGLEEVQPRASSPEESTGRVTLLTPVGPPLLRL